MNSSYKNINTNKLTLRSPCNFPSLFLILPQQNPLPPVTPHKLNTNLLIYVIHILIFTLCYALIILTDYINMSYLIFDLIWIIVMNMYIAKFSETYVCLIFSLLFTCCYMLMNNFLTFDLRFIFIIVLLQFIVIILFSYAVHILLVSILFELFSLLLFIILISSRFGYKILILWYYYMLNLINFIILFMLLYFMLNSFCFYLNDLAFILFDEEWLGILCVFYIILISFKVYTSILILFIEQLYIRLGIFIFIYMLTFYIFFCFILIIILVNFMFYYIFLIKLTILQCFMCVLIGLNSYAIVSLLFILSVNNFCFLFLIFIASKNYIFYVYLNFHFFYSVSLIVIVNLYFFFMVFNIFDINYNENYFFINFVFFSFFNNIILSIMLCTVFLSIGAIPIVFGFFIKLFNMFIFISYLGITLIFFCIIWLIVIYIFYFRLIVNLFNFSFYSLNFWVLKFNSIYTVNINLMLSIVYYIIFFDVINIFDIVF